VIAGTYAHATAPLRRLADRYVLDVLCRLDTGDRPTADELATLDRLPEVMERAETVAARADRATVDLVEAVLLEGREGEVFGATAVDVDDDLVLVQLDEPTVRTRVRLAGAEPGQRVRLRLVAADPQRRRVELEAE
jgi:exoribonuclease R